MYNTPYKNRQSVHYNGHMITDDDSVLAVLLILTFALMGLLL